MKVCRVCLAMSVKMYHMPEHKLSDMYERVTGVKVNSEDKLPKMICWECVARLSSANNFIEKALKTQWILLKKVIGDKITMSDIESIDRLQYKLESALGCKYNEVNNTDFYIQGESDIISDNNDASNVELVIIKHEASEMKDVENSTVKSELLDVTEHAEEADLQVPTITKNENVEELSIDYVTNASEMCEYEYIYPAAHKGGEVCEDIKQEQKDFSVTPLCYRSEGLPYDKDVKVGLEDVMLSLTEQNTQDSFKEVTNNYMSYLKVQSVQNEEIETHPTINKGTLTNSNNMDTDSADTIDTAKCIFPGLDNLQISYSNNTNKTFYATTTAFNSNIDFTYYDAESSKKVFICDICKKSFQFKIHLKQHIQGHYNLFNCTYCKYKTCRKAFLTKHIDTKHIKNNSLKCSYCSYKVSNKSDLNKHVNRKHTKSTVLNCSYCNYKTYDTTSLRKHVNSKHTKNNVYNCSYCSYKAYGKSTLKNHVNAKHTKNLVYNCSYCDYKAYRKTHLNDHVNAKHTKNAVYNCSYCDYTTFNKRHLNRHVNALHTKNVVFDCSHCDYISYSKSNLTRHIKTKHSKSIVYNCPYCSHIAYSKRALNHHVKALHTKKTIVYCAHCDYKSCRKTTLTKHINTKHTKSSVYNCSYCSYKAYSKGTLTKHINTKHTKSTVYNCSYCGYEACSKSILTKHINTKHTKSTVYNCSYCSYIAYSKSTLTKHINTKHAKNTVFYCAHCSYKEHDKNNLCKHIKSEQSD